MSEIIQKPFADYADWNACIEEQTKKGHSKESTEKICGGIKNRTEKSEKEDCPCKMRILKADNGRFIIYGPASVEIRDKEKDKILEKGLQIALPQLLRRGRLSLAHQDILVGEIMPEYESESDGKLYKTEVRDKQLMLVGDIWDDTRASLDTRQKILEKKLRSFSISGEVLKAQRICEQDGCYREISKLDLHAVTICEEGMNPAAKFDVVAKSDPNGDIFLTIATPSISIESASQISKEAEVIHGMTEPQNTPPKQEAKLKKEDMTEQEMEQEQKQEGGDIAEMKGMVGQMLEMMKQMMQAMTGNNGGGAEIEAAQKATPAPTAAAVQAATEKPLTKADIELIIKQALAQKAAEQPDGTTPRPAIKKQHDVIVNSELAEIIKDPSRLEKMSYGHLREIVEGD